MQKGIIMEKEQEEILKSRHHYVTHVTQLTRIIIKAVLPVVLLLAGLWLLTLRLAGWSIIFGLPMVVLGVIFLIYAYDEILSVNNLDSCKDKGLN